MGNCNCTASEKSKRTRKKRPKVATLTSEIDQEKMDHYRQILVDEEVIDPEEQLDSHECEMERIAQIKVIHSKPKMSGDPALSPQPSWAIDHSAERGGGEERRPESVSVSPALSPTPGDPLATSESDGRDNSSVSSPGVSYLKPALKTSCFNQSLSTHTTSQGGASSVQSNSMSPQSQMLQTSSATAKGGQVPSHLYTRTDAVELLLEAALRDDDEETANSYADVEQVYTVSSPTSKQQRDEQQSKVVKLANRDGPLDVADDYEPTILTLGGRASFGPEDYLQEHLTTELPTALARDMNDIVISNDSCVSEVQCQSGSSAPGPTHSPATVLEGGSYSYAALSFSINLLTSAPVPTAPNQGTGTSLTSGTNHIFESHPTSSGAAGAGTTSFQNGAGVGCLTAGQSNPNGSVAEYPLHPESGSPSDGSSRDGSSPRSPKQHDHDRPLAATGRGPVGGSQSNSGPSSGVVYAASTTGVPSGGTSHSLVPGRSPASMGASMDSNIRHVSFSIPEHAARKRVWDDDEIY